MKQDIVYKNHYTADDGKAFICKTDEPDEETGKVYQSKDIWIGNGDSIENYIEVDEEIYEGGEDVNDSNQ